MARPFEIALEDAVTEENNQPELVDVSDVIEETAIAEEEAEENAEIDEQVEALAEASEEADAMLDQSDVNEAKIEEGEQAVENAGGDEAAADDAISEDDIVTSEENLKYSITRLGCDDDLPRNLRLSMEARASGQSRLARLKLAQEGVGDFIAKVISTIKTLIKRIIISCKKLFAKVLFLFGRYDKKAKQLSSRLTEVAKEAIELVKSGSVKEKAAKLMKDFESGNMSIEKLMETGAPYVSIVKTLYKRVPSIGLVYNDGENYKSAQSAYKGVYLYKDVNSYMKEYEKLTEAYVQELVNDKSGDKADKQSKFKFFDELIKKFRSKATDKEKFVSKYSEPGAAPADINGGMILGIIKDTVYYIPGKIEGKVIKTFKPSKNLGASLVDKVVTGNFYKGFGIKDIEGLFESGSINSVEDFARLALKEFTSVTDPKAVFKSFDDTESTYLKFLESLDKKYGSGKDAAKNRRLKIGLDVLRVGASEFNLFCVRSYIDFVKSTFYVADAGVSVLEQIVSDLS